MKAATRYLDLADSFEKTLGTHTERGGQSVPPLPPPSPTNSYLFRKSQMPANRSRALR